MLTEAPEPQRLFESSGLAFGAVKAILISTRNFGKPTMVRPLRLLVSLPPDAKKWLQHRRKTSGVVMSKTIVRLVREAMEAEKAAKPSRRADRHV